MKKLIFCWLLLTSYNCFSQNCDLLIKYGMYDTHTSDYSKERIISYLNIFKQDRSITYTDAKSMSSTMGIPLEGIMAQFGLSASEDSYQQFIDNIQSTTSFDDHLIDKLQTYSKTVNSDMARVLMACYEQPGINAWIETNSDPSIFTLHVLFKSKVNHAAVPLVLQCTNKKQDFSSTMPFNNEGKVKLIARNGVEQTISIRRLVNNTIDLTLNLAPRPYGRISGIIWPSRDDVPIQTNTLTIEKLKVAKPKPVVTAQTITLPSKDLGRTSGAVTVGPGDQELKRINTTFLTGDFIVSQENQTNIVAIITARIEERGGDHTAFAISTKYNVYSAPPGYKITGFNFGDKSPFNCTFPNVQQHSYGQTELGEGPLVSYSWLGDTGSKQDQITGCWISPVMKQMTVTIDRTESVVMK